MRKVTLPSGELVPKRGTKRVGGGLALRLTPAGDRLERSDDVTKRERIALGDEGSQAARQAGRLVEGRGLHERVF